MFDDDGFDDEPQTVNGLMAAFAPCFMCKEPFFFDPETVISVPIDPVTGLPPDLGGDPARAVKQPIDARCLQVAAAQRRRRGLPPWRFPNGRPAT